MSETLHVLVVDDEEGMRLGVARSLRDFRVDLPDMDEQVHFGVAQAATGEEALAAIGAQRPDILLLDHKLPGMSGLEVLEQIGGEDQGILTIMITAYASLETAITATKRGAYDFLAKPFTPGELRAAIRKATKHLMLRRQARKLAEERRQVRFAFISVLAHELKAPLAAIDGYLDLMGDRTAGDSLDNYEHIIDRCRIRLDGMRKLIFDLLDMTRIESGQKKREFSDVYLPDVAQASIESFLPEAQKRDIIIDLRADEVSMLGDRGELEIILNNLVSNAVKYNRDGGKVTVRIEDRPSEDAVAISVSDTGIGMSEEETAKLFRDFVRIKNARTRNILGSGLGLSTVKKLARLYRGDVSVESRPEVGSTFTAILRKHTSEQVDHDASDEHSGPAAGE